MEDAKESRVCPKCGSQNIKYELRSAGISSKTNYYRTGIRSSFFLPTGTRKHESRKNLKSIGFCQNCGHYWDVESDTPAHSIGCAFAIIALLFWPITLSVWFYKTDKINLDRRLRIAIIAAFLAGLVLWSEFSTT